MVFDLKLGFDPKLVISKKHHFEGHVEDPTLINSQLDVWFEATGLHMIAIFGTA